VAEVEGLEREGAITPDASLLGPGIDELETEENTVDDPSGPGQPEVAGMVTAASEPAEHQQLEGTMTGEDAITRLRVKIDRLGPVNMMAIDQFDELETRYAFLTNQRKDLVESIIATGQAVKRIDQTTRERFREAFTAINEHFQDTFTTLFGGGRAGLVLLDEADLLESGVDIIAQPPGKRLQNVQLLSGGEKALSAMALMFAIFKYKPSPFCLLDEIDAPLDDVNISRFLEMLHGMQTHTQFILVTHNRHTMEIADRLYGVTMEEPGVSKLISVKLN
jgi:chromosome segregation protein